MGRRVRDRLLDKERRRGLLVCHCEAGPVPVTVTLFGDFELTDVYECDRCGRLIWKGKAWPVRDG